MDKTDENGRCTESFVGGYNGKTCSFCGISSFPHYHKKGTLPKEFKIQTREPKEHETAEVKAQVPTTTIKINTFIYLRAKELPTGEFISTGNDGYANEKQLELITKFSEDFLKRMRELNEELAKNT